MTAKRIIALLTAVVIAVTMLTACGDDSELYTFRIDLEATPENLDPQVSTDEASAMILQNTMEGLMTHDSEGNLICGAAKDYEVSQDGLKYTFNIDENCYWVYKGEKAEQVTAHDFVFAFQRIFDVNTGSPAIKQFMCIKNAWSIVEGEMPKEALGVYASDSSTLVIELDYAYEGLLELLSTTATFPCSQSFFTETKGKYGLEYASVMTNGPFCITSWRKGKYFTLSKSESYAKPETVKAEYIVLYVDKPEEERVKRFEDGTTDVMRVSGSDISALVEQDFGYAQFQDISWCIVQNCADETLSSTSVRRALARAFTDDAYSNHLPIWLGKSGAVVPPAVTTQGISYRRFAGLDLSLEYLPENALDELSKGLEELEIYSVPRLTMISPSEEPFGFLVQFVQQTWQSDLSVFVNLSAVPAQDIEKEIAGGDWQLALVPLKSDTGDAEEFLTMFTSDSPKNIWGYSNPEYDALIEKAAHAQRGEQGRGYLIEAENKLIDDGVIIPFAYQTSFYAFSKNSKDIEISPFGGGLTFKYAYKTDK